MAKTILQQLNLFCVTVVLILITEYNSIYGSPLPEPNPQPQVPPNQIPPHIASHPALSSITNSKESALLQYALNTQNRRGPGPSPLVLQQNQHRNLALVNSIQGQRSGQPFLPGNAGQFQGNQQSYQQGNANPEAKAFEVLQQFKSQGQASSGSSGSYEPVALTPSPSTYPYHPQHQHQHQQLQQHQHQHLPPGGPPGAQDLGQENEREDIRRLKSLLNLSGRPGAQGAAGPNFGGTPGSPSIGVVSQRGVITPGNPHDHHHHHGQPPQQPYSPSVTPYPVTSPSQNSFGNVPYGQSPRPSVYSDRGGPTSAPAGVIHVPYGSNGNQHVHIAQDHGHDHQHQHNHGQDARTLIQSLDNPSAAYQPLVYVDPVRDPSSINRHVQPSQSVFILPASDFQSDDFQRLLNRPAEILIDVIPADGRKQGGDFELHNFSLLLTPSTYARCAQATHKKGYGGKCKLILKVGKKSGPFAQPVQVSY